MTTIDVVSENEDKVEEKEAAHIKSKTFYSETNVPHEQVVSITWGSSNSEKLLQVVELSMNVSADCKKTQFLKRMVHRGCSD